MENSFLKKYKCKSYSDFIIDKQLIELLKTLIQMDNLNILFIGNPGTGKTSLKKFPNITFYILITLKSKVYNIIEMKLKPFVKLNLIYQKKRNSLF